MAVPRWQSIRPNFSGSNQAMANAQRGIAGFTSDMANYRKQFADEKRQGILDKRYEDNLNYQKGRDTKADNRIIAADLQKENQKQALMSLYSDTSKNEIAEKFGRNIAERYDAISGANPSELEANREAFRQKLYAGKGTDQEGNEYDYSNPKREELYNTLADVSANKVLDHKAYSNEL